MIYYIIIISQTLTKLSLHMCFLVWSELFVVVPHQVNGYVWYPQYRPADVNQPVLYLLSILKHLLNAYSTPHNNTHHHEKPEQRSTSTCWLCLTLILYTTKIHLYLPLVYYP